MTAADHPPPAPAPPSVPAVPEGKGRKRAPPAEAPTPSAGAPAPGAGDTPSVAGEEDPGSALDTAVRAKAP
jgi:hypothetical protein